MKLPEPYIYYEDGETYTAEAVQEIFDDDSGLEKLYTEAQLREALAQQEDVLRRALNFLNEVDLDDNDRDFLRQSQCETLDEVRSLILEALDNK